MHDDMDKSSMAPQSEKAKMLAGELYRSADPELIADTQRAQRLLRQYNATSGDEMDARTALLRQLLGSVGDGAVVRPFFACDYGFNIRLGRNAFINYNCVFLDCAPIEVGDDLQMGPAVQLYTAEHPLEPDVRRSGLEYARPIRIGHNVWIGGGAIILAGLRSVMPAWSALEASLRTTCLRSALSWVTRPALFGAVRVGGVVGVDPAGESGSQSTIMLVGNCGRAT
jgi:maltose O-acetyltransferase